MYGASQTNQLLTLKNPVQDVGHASSRGSTNGMDENS